MWDQILTPGASFLKRFVVRCQLLVLGFGNPQIANINYVAESVVFQIRKKVMWVILNSYICGVHHYKYATTAAISVRALPPITLV